MENITNVQRELIGKLESVSPGVTVHWDEMRGVSSSTRGKLKARGGEEAFTSFLKEFGLLFGLADEVLEHLKLQSRRPDKLHWKHLVFQQMAPLPGHDIIEVYGAKIAAHINPQGVLVEVQSSLWRDFEVQGDLKIDPDTLREIMARQIEDLDGYEKLRSRVMEKEPEFPISDRARVVVYPWRKQFPLAWTTFGYGLHDRDVNGLTAEKPHITYGRIFVDATTGQRITFSPTLQSAETAATATGLAVTPLTGTRSTRPLDVVRVDNGNTYRLKNTTNDRDIITHDAGCSTSYNQNDEIGNAISGGSLPVSEDTDGDHDWDTEPTDTTVAQRSAAQLPEVDAHYFVNRQYQWYKALGRTGWDDDNYPDPPVPDQTINVLAHCYPPDNWGDNCTTFNGYKWARKVSGDWVYWLAFQDGNGSTYDYPAGSHFIVAHEYQHAVTDFTFQDSNNNPGLEYDGWLGAVHEGLSDVFGILSSGQWLPCTDVSHSSPAVVFRNLVYPRDANAHDANNLDHFDDRNNTTDFYGRGTILAHCAYLMGKGGVHQRAGRLPERIPVYGLGRETVNGVNMPKAARIWYRALDNYCSTLGNATGGGSDNTFRTIRNACVSAAEDLFTNDSAEYFNTILAFYAVGLHPETYGADVTFLRWGASWDLSRRYVGLSSPSYSSLDLFINNGGASEWNAIVNVKDPSTGQPTEIENNVYCRVRNVGGKDALNVKVTFEYAKMGTATLNWQPMEDKNGATHVLSLGTLAAGQSSFPDSDQNSPPASAQVKWAIPPLPANEEVDHFCIRATVQAANDVNKYNNRVQSNVAYSEYNPPTPSKKAFIVGNPPKLDIRLPVDLRVEHTLPRDWKAYIVEDFKGMVLKPGEERPFTVVVEPGLGAEEKLAPPLNGDLVGRIQGEIQGSFRGTLTESASKRDRVKGLLSCVVGKTQTVTGLFEGKIDLETAELQGRLTTAHPDPNIEDSIQLRIRACVRPWRRVDVSQWSGDELIGGITVQVQVPWENSPCIFELPPTRTKPRG